MNKRLQLRRALALTVLVCLAFTGLGYRLVDLQVLRHDELSKLAHEDMERQYWETPRRGDILDDRGNLLATSVPVKTVCADPSVMGNQQAVVAQALAPLLQMNESDLYQKLFPRISRDQKGQIVTNNLHYVRLAKNVSEATWEQIQTTMGQLNFGVDEKKLPKAQQTFLQNLRLSAIFAESDQMRVYPNGALAAQVLGFSGDEDATVDGHVVSKIMGRDGVELSLNKELSGVAGWRVTDTDRQNHELVSTRDEDVQVRDGLNVELTIDAVVQHILETELADAMQKHTPRSITGIVMRPDTGEILAMASLPNYDPNQPNTVTPDMRDRDITDVMEPGSVFKIVPVSGALNDGIVHLNDEFDCEQGHFAFAGRILHDSEPHGVLTTEGIITKSSNIGAAKVGIKLGEDRLYDYAQDYGFGVRTGIPLPGEVGGILYPVKDWTRVSIAQIPMGQGVGVTRLQMLMAMGAIANDGWLMHPMLVKCLTDRTGNVIQQYEPQRVRQIITDGTDKDMIEALKTVVTAEGTAPGAAMKEYVVAGKTGTAQKVENGAYVHGKYFASFIGFFPADNPQLVISIVMDEPKEGFYGGLVCGPVFHNVAERCASYLNIPPEENLQATNSFQIAATTLNGAQTQ
ncbi:MAG TPA: penicillin-binding transpeptidase domain-containing protein [Verrucomicrobiae bacterium]|jgi:cell division protein FtsI/penicillin-binding protein 2